MMVRLIQSPLGIGWDALSKLVRHGEFTDSLAAAISADGGAERAIKALNREFSLSVPDAELPADHYRVRVNRGPLPPMSVLEKQFSGDVSHYFDEGCLWQKHRSRLGGNDVKAEEVIMVVKRFTKEEIREIGGLTCDNVIEWGLTYGLLPANEKEAYAFGTNPQTRRLLRGFSLVACGSLQMDQSGYHFVTLLENRHRGVSLSVGCFHGEWSTDMRFLFVRKSA